ncbi:MAG: sulfite exporter TauE/SafE family protein [Candidatus Eremiobacteraeota bacterium]|nr:sulfite exporter TauE/SafE family protein [Candidatus Eremiobacteraeota bacterium]MBV8356026.1 sulfite exporter TauE/SafE family protein [Candidatus Eremiobacteraeota bacterium]
MLAHGSLVGILVLFGTGFLASIFGALVGLGGGFLIIPILRLLFNVAPAVAAGNSLLFVLANTIGASITYLRRGVVDVRRGVTIAIAGIPTSVLGAYVVRQVKPATFDTIYGAFLVALAIMVIVRGNREPKPRLTSPRVQILLEIAAGIFLGFFSSFFGIGGGIVMVPTLLMFFGMPVHVVSATSSFVVMLTSPVGVITHALYGHIVLTIGLPLVAGGLVGGSLGAYLAKHVSRERLTSLLAGGLILAAIALAVRHLAHLG